MGSMIDITTRRCRFTADIFQPKRSKTLNPRKFAISAAENTNYPLISITCLAALIAPWSREPQIETLVIDACDLGDQLADNPINDDLFEDITARINAAWDEPQAQQLDFWRP
jgi:hypothetical protein